MKLFLTDFISLGSIQSALDQPIFPGKLVVWLLFMLSIVGWVMILSKALQLWRVAKADRAFENRLRESRTTLELFEIGWRSEDSILFLIYLAGARETAFQLLGSRAPVREMQRRILDAGKLSTQQEGFLEAAFESGYRQARRKLGSGVAGLRFVAASATLLSVIGCVWTLMDGFDSLAPEAAFGPIIGTSLGFLAIGLLVVTPTILARIAFSIHIERRRYEIEKFRDDISRLFERKFARLESNAGETPERGSVEEPEPAGEEDEPADAGNEVDFPEPGGSSGSGRKRYHSIRDRLLRPPGESGSDQFTINPIARQAHAADAR